jgi:hypothetical protein
MALISYLRWTLPAVSLILEILQSPAQQPVLGSKLLHACPDAALQFS